MATLTEYIQPAWLAMSEALLIGLLVGVEREADRVERHAGMRDFITIGLAGGLCGVLNQPWLTASALLSLTALMLIFRVQTPERTGITTEFAGVATFLLTVLTATPGLPWASPLAIALTVILALFLEMRSKLRKWFVESLSQQEFRDTLRFLAVVFVILPVLPNVDLGPYGFFNPHRVWLFVILVCSISFAGYMLEKFIGGGRGLRLTAVLGGLVSTTAATTAFARMARENPPAARAATRAAILANAVQAPRVLAVIVAVSPALAWASLPVLLSVTAAGAGWAWLTGRGAGGEGDEQFAIGVKNPFSLLPALKFGLLFALIRLISRALSYEYGSQGVLWASGIGGSVDVDSVVFVLAGLFGEGRADAELIVSGVLIGLLANAAMKTFLAFSGGGRRYGAAVARAFAVMLTAGAIALAAKAWW
jgi:uncharacterized membrane protein (DUF4010 family)